MFKELSLDVNKKHLIDIFEKNQSKIKKYAIKNVNNEILGYRDYYELYFSFADGKEFFHHIFPYKCRGYQYVYMPPNYEMVIHRDISYILCRIGCILIGSATIDFYDDKYTLINKYNYNKPILFDTQILHNVKNSNEYRLTFFVNFEDPIEKIEDILFKNNHII